MDSDENIPAQSALDLDSESQVRIPTEVWSKIISFLPLHDRCRVEGVNWQLSKVAKSSWDKLQLNKLWISSISFDSAAKFATLLRRCGSHLEEMLTERDIRVESDDQIFHLCPNLKVLSFACGSSLSLARDTDKLEVPIPLRVRQLLTSLPQLERLQFFSTIVTEDEGDSAVDVEDFLPGLIHVQSLQELHLPLTCLAQSTMRYFGALEQLRVLSVSVVPPDTSEWSGYTSIWYRTDRRIIEEFDFFIGGICQLYQLEELQVRLSGEHIQHFTPSVVGKLAKSLPSLRSLVLVFGNDGGQIQSGCIKAMIRKLTQLRTLMIVCQLRSLPEINVNLNKFHNRHVPLNVFVVDYCLSHFIGYSPQINVISMPNDHTGDAINFLSSYSQNGFAFANEKCLQMVKMSKEVDGIWDFAYESEGKEESDGDDC